MRVFASAEEIVCGNCQLEVPASDDLSASSFPLFLTVGWDPLECYMGSIVTVLCVHHIFLYIQ